MMSPKAMRRYIRYRRSQKLKCLPDRVIQYGKYILHEIESQKSGIADRADFEIDALCAWNAFKWDVLMSYTTPDNPNLSDALRRFKEDMRWVLE